MQMRPTRLALLAILVCFRPAQAADTYPRLVQTLPLPLEACLRRVDEFAAKHRVKPIEVTRLRLLRAVRFDTIDAPGSYVMAICSGYDDTLKLIENVDQKQIDKARSIDATRRKAVALLR